MNMCPEALAGCRDADKNISLQIRLFFLQLQRFVLPACFHLQKLSSTTETGAGFSFVFIDS